MLPSAVNDTMRDMMAQIRDVGDGIRGGTYTMTAPVITGGSVTGVTAVSTSGNLTFTGTGNRILGDFTNATFANRVSFQTSTTNSGTSLTALPNGTGTLSQLQFYSNSDPTNSSRLTVFNNNAVCGLSSDISGTGTYLPIVMNTNGAERLRIDTSGNCGIGTSSPAQKLDVQAADYVAIRAFSTNSSIDTRLQSFSTGGYGYAGTVSNHPFSFITNNTERMRIDSSGNLLVGNTSSGLGTTKFLVDNAGANISTIFQNTGATSAATEVSRYYHAAATGATSATIIQFLNSSGAGVGSITCNGTATLYNTTSDYRLKNVIAPVANSGQRIDALQPIEYNWKTGGRTRGFLAHQFAEIYPNSVSGEKDAVDAEGKPKYQGMQASTPEVMADLIAEIQSLRKRVAQLESK
jgi:hypothetical protein